MSNLFAKLEQEAFRAGITPRSRASIRWFKNKIGAMRSVNRQALMQEKEIQKMQADSSMIGSMFMYFYDPKLKLTLPYYDKFPLIIMVGPAAGGFYGLNLHYLPMTLRAKFLDTLMGMTNNKKYDTSTTFNVKYEFLQKAAGAKYFKPCFKHYLTKHVRGQVALVSAPEWEIATFLPTADFEKASQNTVWGDSRRIING
jgi:hypothetical protein